MRAVDHELIGRRDEMAAVAETIDALHRGSALYLHVLGEPGIGKTRLLMHAVEEADRRGQLVLTGRATEFERNYPFGAFVDALDPHLGTLGPDWFDRLGREGASELARIFPALARSANGGQSALQAERFRAYDAVRDLLGFLAESGPLVLAIDDLQWADPASVELLSHLLRRPVDGPVLLLLAYRPHQAAPQLHGVLEAVKRGAFDGQRSRILELGPLSAGQCQQLLGSTVSGEAAGRLYEESGGNPFYLEQLARAEAMGTRADRWNAGAHDLTVPPAVTASITEELASLSPRTLDVLTAAAVVGEPFDPRVMAAVAAHPEPDAFRALDDLVQLDLVRVASSAPLFRFRHPIVRRAVYESARPGWRISAHRRAARVLGEKGASAISRAEHIERSASPGDEDAIEILTAAGNAAAARAPSAAASWFGSALRLLPATEDNTPRRLLLLVSLAIALGAVGRLEESRDALREALDLLPPEPSELRTKAIVAAATVDVLLGDRRGAEAILLEALAEQPDPHSRGATELKCGLAYSCFSNANWPKMRTWAQRALAEGHELDSAVRASATSALALAEYGLSNPESARDHVQNAAGLLDVLPDDELLEGTEPIMFLGLAEHCLGLSQDANRHMERALALSRASGQGHVIVGTLAVRSMALAWIGGLEEAATSAQHGIESALLSANDLFKLWALSIGCLVERQRGDLRSAIRYGEESVEAGDRIRSPWVAVATCYLAEAWLDLGEAARCRELLISLQGGPMWPLFPFNRSRFYELRARSELQLGNLAVAVHAASNAQRAAAKIDVPGQLAEAARAQAAVLSAFGEHAEAASTAQKSANLFDRAGAPMEAARARILAGRALGQAGEREPAVQELLGAEAALSAAGSARYRMQAAHELRQLGHRVSRIGAPLNGNGLGGLTPRQLQVAELAAPGRTNRQIADELYLSEKGVESHMRRIFGRLEVSSRTALAALIAKAGTPSGT